MCFSFYRYFEILFHHCFIGRIVIGPPASITPLCYTKCEKEAHTLPYCKFVLIFWYSHFSIICFLWNSMFSISGINNMLRRGPQAHQTAPKDFCCTKSGKIHLLWCLCPSHEQFRFSPSLYIFPMVAIRLYDIILQSALLPNQKHVFVLFLAHIIFYGGIIVHFVEVTYFTVPLWFAI